MPALLGRKPALPMGARGSVVKRDLLSLAASCLMTEAESQARGGSAVYPGAGGTAGPVAYIDHDACLVLADACEEASWRPFAVMMLVLGIEISLDTWLQDRRPRGNWFAFARRHAEAEWTKQKGAAFALWDDYSGRHSSYAHRCRWVMAVYAVLLFESWKHGQRARYRTSSPWATVKLCAYRRWERARGREVPLFGDGRYTNERA